MFNEIVALLVIETSLCLHFSKGVSALKSYGIVASVLTSIVALITCHMCYYLWS